MDLEVIFSFVNSLAFFCWVALLIFPFSKRLKMALTGVVISGLALLYTYFIGQSIEPDGLDSFSTLAGIGALFSDPAALLAGWIHYLAFDLMMGMYITNNAEKYGINRWLLIPCLIFTFMLGPVGLLLYFIIRIIYSKRYFHTY
ncbi:MAG: hypothetical protein ACJAT1_000792 [Marivirga sp.]|jgi:hypothetical protein